jgi:predicted Rdx family selenoprotein
MKLGIRLHIKEESRFTTFESSRGNSNVDLTLTDDTFVTLVKEWQRSEQESFPDHRIITFRIETQIGPTRQYIHHGIKYVTSEEKCKN